MGLCKTRVEVHGQVVVDERLVILVHGRIRQAEVEVRHGIVGPIHERLLELLDCSFVALRLQLLAERHQRVGEVLASGSSGAESDCCPVPLHCDLRIALRLVNCTQVAHGVRALRVQKVGLLQVLSRPVWVTRLQVEHADVVSRSEHGGVGPRGFLVVHLGAGMVTSSLQARAQLRERSGTQRGKSRNVRRRARRARCPS
mmetsp:Transcript_49365/g.127375  ORF Transcript_49365/g.127375 Transcript_49365/m.127375 type:complete len:200 (+) Transcript_49365:2169-2768(+)